MSKYSRLYSHRPNPSGKYGWCAATASDTLTDDDWGFCTSSCEGTSPGQRPNNLQFLTVQGVDTGKLFVGYAR